MLFLGLLGNMWGCNPKNVQTQYCAKPESISGTVAELRTIDDVQNKRYRLNDYQKKAFRGGERVYFLRLKNTVKMDRLYFDSFYIESSTPLSAKDILDKRIYITYTRICLKNFFYSKGLEGRRYPGKKEKLLFINTLPVLKIERMKIEK